MTVVLSIVSLVTSCAEKEPPFTAWDPFDPEGYAEKGYYGITLKEMCIRDSSRTHTAGTCTTR